MKNSALLLLFALLTVPVRAQVEQPFLASAQLPFYPQLARMARVQGTVELDVTVSPEGKVLAAKAVSGNPLLRTEAERNVKTWTVQWPTLLKSSVQRKVEFVFKLSDKSAPAYSPFTVTVSGIERIEIDADAFPVQTNESRSHPK